jgi:peptidyl-tRNA hydrolase, PTH1 family
MRLIVGLGNPDPEYQWTPHNLGFLAVDELANRGSIRVERPEAKALVGRGKLAGEDVLLAKPQTYMNLSGISVRELLEKYELGPGDLLVLWDEVQLPFGTIRIDRKGSGGSHNGANSVIAGVGTQEFSRIRLGCGPDHPLSSRKEFVLRPMKKAALEVAAEMAGKAGDAVEMILEKGIEPAMNIFNRRKLPEAEEPQDE